jgi:ribokinase
MKQVIVVGSLNVDIVVRTPILPREGQTILGHSFAKFPGGKGANQSVGMARLGAHVTHMGKVGMDDHAQMLRNSLKDAGVNMEGLIEDGLDPTGAAFVQVADSGANTIVVVPGANMRLFVSDLEPFIPSLKRAEIIVLQNEIPMETNLAVAGIGKEAGAMIIYSPAPVQQGSDKICSLGDYIVLNETELSELTGLTASTNQEVERAAGKLLKLSQAEAVIATLGSKGCMIRDRKNTELIPAIEVNVKDTTAAGDAFVAGMAVGLSEGKSLREAVRLAIEVAGYSVTVLGAQPSLPTREQLDEFKSRLGRIAI